MTGTIVLGVGGFYETALDGGERLRCRLRGRFRKDGMRPLVGDRVRVRAGGTPDGDGVIEEILPRRSQLVRPPIANVDQAVIVLACAEPAPDRFFLDRLLVHVFHQGLDAVLCLNKADLVPREEAEAWIAPYRDVVRTALIVSAHAGWGIDALAEALRGRISTMAGPSGVGKSALLNAVSPDFRRRTGDVSRRLGRGRHTTRAVELLALPGGGWVADTPGFSQLDVTDIPPESLAGLFPDLARHIPDCRFPGCAHMKEPDCAVRRAAQEGVVPPWRYRHYQLLMEELLEAQARQYR